MTVTLPYENKAILKYFALYQFALACIWTGLLTWFQFSLAMNLSYLLWWVCLPLQWGMALFLYRMQNQNISLSAQYWLALLVISVWILSALLYFTGGIINPLSYLLLVPLTLGAMLFNGRNLIILALIAALCFLGLTQYYVPIMSLKIQSLNNFFYWHLNGSVAVYILLTLLVIGLVVPLKKQLDASQKTAQKLKNKAIQSEYVLSVATLAAASIHQLSTPLNTLSLIESLLRGTVSEAEKQDYLDMMANQIATCEQTLKSLRKQADLSQQNQPGLVDLGQFLKSLRQEFALLHPKSELQIIASPNLELELTSGFKLALFNLLNNAARHSPDYIAINCYQLEHQLVFDVIDKGEGISYETLSELGKAPTTEFEDMGIGIYLTQLLMELCQGQLSYHPQTQGMIARLSLEQSSIKLRKANDTHSVIS